MSTNYASQVEPRESVLDWTLDKLGAGDRWQREIEAALKPREAELVEFDRESLEFEDGMAASAVYSFCIAGKVDLDEADTPSVVRVKLVNELRALAEAIEREGER